jgi:hypothetical protein
MLDAREAADDARPVQWMSHFQAIHKIDPVYTDEMLAASAGVKVDVEIELLDSVDRIASIERISRLASSVNREPRRFLKFVVLSLTIPAEELITIAALEDVLFVGPAFRFATEDERSAQILAANLTPDSTQPSGPGYMSWLASKSLNTQSDFVVDIADSGLDRGLTSDFSVHPDFLDADGHSRVVYNVDYSGESQKQDRRGHGSLVASVIGGLGASDREDASGYMFGIGVDPTARLGASKIFDTIGKLGPRMDFTDLVSSAYAAGAASLIRKFFTVHNLLGASRAPSPAMTKAFLVNSASYLSGENAGGNLPSDRQGWGIANLSRAFDGVARKLVDQTTLFTESGQTYEVEGSIAERAEPLRVTLTWTDAPGALAAAALVNDLDLEVTIGGVTVYRGNHFEGATSVEGGDQDRLYNVESITIPASAIPQGFEGNFKITVRAANVAGDGVPGNENNLDQDFALVVYNITDPLPQAPPPPVKKIPVITNATYVKKTIKITGHDFTAAASVEINGKVIEKTFSFDAATNSLSLKLKVKKLNLNKHGDSQIVLIENNERSTAFTLHLD